MTTLRRPDTAPAQLAELRAISDRLRAESAADTVAGAYGIGPEVFAWYDESGGRLFDLASLTKPLFTARAVLGLLAADEGWANRAGQLLARDGAPSPSIRSLLSHSAGLPADLPSALDVDSVADWCGARLVTARDGERVVYSDAGYWALGWLVEATTGEDLYTTFERAAGQDSFAFGRAEAARAVPAGPVEGGVQMVHDPAARRLGDCGHAGAFGTLDAVVAATLGWTEPAWAGTTLAEEALTCRTHLVPGGHRSLAWTLAGDPFHAVAHDWPATTVCHTGFTGVSIAWDPESRWWAVLLSNAVPVDRDATPILIARRLFHAAAARTLRAAHDDPARTTRGAI